MQSDLFGHQQDEAIQGLTYEPNFLSEQEEEELLTIIQTLALHPVQYKEHESKCKIISYGGIYDFTTNSVKPSLELDPRLLPLRRRVAEWSGIDSSELVQVLVTEYAPGTQLGWHRDVPSYETVIGISLGSATNLAFRRYPPTPTTNRLSTKLVLEPRSIYKLEGTARWGWQHSIPPVKHRRWSITLRTKRIHRNSNLFGALA